MRTYKEEAGIRQVCTLRLFGKMHICVRYPPVNAEHERSSKTRRLHVSFSACRLENRERRSALYWALGLPSLEKTGSRRMCCLSLETHLAALPFLRRSLLLYPPPLTATENLYPTRWWTWPIRQVETGAVPSGNDELCQLRSIGDPRPV